MSRSNKQRSSSESEALASIPQAVRTVNLTVIISVISLSISLFTLFLSVRPASVEPVVSAVFASSEGGSHVSIPLSIVNTGAQPAAVVAAKLIESDAVHQSVWSADFTAEPNRAIPAMTSAVTRDNSALWVPFQVPGKGQIERVFIFRPQSDTSPSLIRSGRSVTYRVVLLMAGGSEATVTTSIIWPAITDAVMNRKEGGVAAMATDLERWLSASPR